MILPTNLCRRFNLSCLTPWLMTSLACLALPSCVSLAPYRTTAVGEVSCLFADTHADPTSDGYGAVPPRCASLMKETAFPVDPGVPNYSLHFVEFDDQGRLFPGDADHPDISNQTELMLSDIRSIVKPPHGDQDGGAAVSIVVFVHGWKHDAETNDSNVRWFRAMLSKLNDVEKISECKRQVIGVYAGWHGAATTLPLVEDATFWTRKKAAGRVAEGEVRELLTRLRAIQDIRNAKWNGYVEASRQHPKEGLTEPHLACSKKVRLTIVGHSFGGLVVYNALDQSLIRDVADLHERMLDANDPVIDPLLTREGDLIVTINPAVEAARFVPLWFAARAAHPKSYHAPTFVSITSTDDDATRLAFPAARSLNTLLNHYPKGNSGEHGAAIETIGQDQDYIDYDLNTISNLNKNRPAGEDQLVTDPACEQLKGADFAHRYLGELAHLEKFDAALRQHPDANDPALGAHPKTGEPAGIFPRQLCINDNHFKDGDLSMALRPRRGVNLNSPIWNVSTARPIVDGHSDLLNPLLVDFLRQLYEEGTRPDLNHLTSSAPGPDMDAAGRPKRSMP